MRYSIIGLSLFAMDTSKVLWTHIVLLISCLIVRGQDENSTSFSEVYLGCSFSSDDWCNNTNVYDGTNGPQWTRQTAPAEQNPIYNYHQYNYNPQPARMTLYGSFAMEWPPKGDYYIHTGPTQSNSFAEMHAELKSPVIVVNDTIKCLYFSYHNRIPIRLTPTLVVRKRTGNSSADDVVLAEYYSTDSQKWFEAQVPLPGGEYSLVFAGKNYNSKAISGGHLAITNIAILNGSCARTVAEWLMTPGDCGFEDMNLCGYRYANDSTVKLLSLLAESLPSSELLQRAERKLPDDRFLAMTSNFNELANQGQQIRLQSPEISTANEGCIYLWYHNGVQSKTDESNALNIVQLEPSSEKVLFRLPIPKSNRDKWFQFNGALPRGTYRLVLELVYTTDFAENDYAAIDNIEIFNKSCSDVKSLADVCNADIPLGQALCRNGGSCISLGKKSFRCVCRDGFFGDRCEQAYACNENPCKGGGSCSNDGKVDFKCQCQQGYDGKRCEKVKTCVPASRAFEYAIPISVTHENYQGTARFKCLDDLTQFGDLTATCNINGEWELQGRCLATNCGNPTNIHGMTLVNATNHTLNGMARYQCSDGYTTYENQDVLLCKASNIYTWIWQHYGEFQTFTGSWLSIYGQGSLSCYPIPNCGQPPAIANAEVNVTSVLMHGVATYRCNSGYELSINQSSVEMNCSRHGQWISTTGNTNLQCFMLPDCGPPPQIPFGVVNYTNTSIDSTASYRCKAGNRLIGSETAVCWRIGENRLQKWVDWLFVPSCELNCGVKVGRNGNMTVAKFEVSTCNMSDFDTFSPRLDCSPAVPYVVNRKPLNKPGEKSAERIVFYGSDLCIAEKVEKVKYYGKSIVYSSTKCKSICFQYPFDIRDIVVYEELRYTRLAETEVLVSPPSEGKLISDFKVGRTTREQRMMRYTYVSP